MPTTSPKPNDTKSSTQRARELEQFLDGTALSNLRKSQPGLSLEDQ